MLNITDTEEHFQTARSMLRAIMMSASTIVIDPRDGVMLTDLTCAIDTELDAIETALQFAA
ncbi:hypothetical protein LB557_01975 [Mesorhizobium sp. BR115XR7A]|uniref:hypothetical protein n=1 Tax=Mesorhizobium sp. BR115XR7A TaxID=2876645 RepID=UPI001CCB3DD1|nr:hypothetical protein [Mesorhizobium sp. BR115XR7A]MBZ9904775.1 hypothetical protein [Mesorhizobium sp. BR115XR7A]MBZ9933042.1 hypothetical protein [Mesorhizobium sp. BR1-1-5]